LIRVGLIGPADRDEIVRLSIRLEERGAEPVILDGRKDRTIRITPEGESACGVDLNGISSFYVADLGLPSPLVRRDDGEPDRMASEKARHHSQGYLSAWNALLARLETRCTVVNPYRTHDIHSLKPWEMTAYERLGLPVPVTFSTSDAESLMNAPGTPGGEWINKGMVGGYDYTEEYDPPGSIEDARRKLEGGPLMVQERIMGDNLRAFVLDGEVIGAAEVVTGSGEETDSRRGDIRVRRVDLPDEAARVALESAGRWGMIFAAIDFMVDARTGRYIILECNSAPFFVNFERYTGLPITSRLAAFLARRRS
jgi:glutathione synthase/RimK-type ligase-like ATP-grasp enzyme